MMAADEEAATAFVETSLGTRIAVSFPAPNTTVAHLKRIVSDEHAASFPRTVQISVEYFKVRRRGSWYHLTDSMPIRAAFHGVRGAWHLHAHVLPHSAAAAAHSECNVHMLHHVLCSHQNAIGDVAVAAQGSEAPSTNQQDGHGHPGDAHQDGYNPVRGQQLPGVIEDLRGRKRFRVKEDGDRDQSVLVGCDGGSLAALVYSVRQDGQNECTHNSMSKRICASREDGLLDVVGANTVGSGGDFGAHSKVLEDEGALDESCCQCHDEGLEKEEDAVSVRPSNLAEPPAELRDHEAKSITNDEEPKLCFSVKQPVELHDHVAKSITNDEEPKLCFSAKQPVELHGHEAKSITNDEDPKLCFSVKQPVELHDHVAKSTTNDEETKLCFSAKQPVELHGHEAKSTTNDQETKLCFLAKQPVELHGHEAKSITNDEEPKLCFSAKQPVELHDHEAKSITNDEEPKLCFSAKQPVELHDREAKSITNDEEPKLCFSVNENDFSAATEKLADEGMTQEKVVEQQDHLDISGAEVVLQNCNSKDTSAIHSEHVSDCHQHEGSSRSFCKSSNREMLTDQVADRDRVCSDVERAPQEKENDHTSDPLLHDLDDCAHSLGERPICGQKEQSIAEGCNSASSKKGKDLPPSVETFKEVNSSEKEAMANKVKGKEPWTANVCNGKRSSSKGRYRSPRAGSMKNGKSSENEEMAQKVKEKETWTAKACNGERSRNKGTDHPPCAGSMREGNSSEKEGLAHGENQSTRTVTLVDVDKTKWEVKLDDSFELGPPERSSFSWSEKEDAEETHSGSAKPHQNAEECPEGAPENGGTRVPTERSDLQRHGSFKTLTSNGPTESKHAGATSANGDEQGAWERRRRPRAVVQKIPNSRAAKMYGYR